MKNIQVTTLALKRNTNWGTNFERNQLLEIASPSIGVDARYDETQPCRLYSE